MEFSFEIAFMQKCFRGALLYKLQRNDAAKTNNQSSGSIAFIDDTTVNTYLLVVWGIGNIQHNFYACLVECDDDFTWNEDKLWALYWEYYHKFNIYYNFITVKA
jgi:hypothetical protein